MAASNTETSHPLSPTVALLLAILGAASMLYYHQRLFMPRAAEVLAQRGLGNGYSFGNDFYQVWLSCRELMQERIDPYSPEMTLRIQEGLYGRPLNRNRPGDFVDQRAFPYPAYTDLLFWPAAQFAFPVARGAVFALLIILTLASVPIWLRALDWHLDWRWLLVAVLLTVCSYPALEGLFAGQIGLLVAFLFSAATLALRRGQHLLAGVLMAVTMIKPQVTALIVVYLLLWTLHAWRERRNFWIGFFSTFVILVTGSLLILPRWITSWLHTVLAYRQYTQPPLVTQVITSWLGPRFSGPATMTLTLAAVLFCVVLAIRNRSAEFGSSSFWLTLTMMPVVTTVFVLPGQAVYDHLILVPAILLLFCRRKELLREGIGSRALMLIGLFVLLWPWISAFVLCVLMPVLPSATLNSNPVLSLPVRTAASLPFVVLMLLLWSWRLPARRVQKALEA